MTIEPPGATVGRCGARHPGNRSAGPWPLLGTSTWDARSRRPTSEMNVKCYSAELAAHRDALVRARINPPRPIPQDDPDARPLPIKLRDGASRLFAPFL